MKARGLGLRPALAAGSVLLACGVALAACGSSDNNTSSGSSSSPSATASLHGNLTVFAAASLTEAFGTLGKQFEQAHPGTKVTFSFGASSTLAQQILQGAPADVFASASQKNMDQVSSKGEIAGTAKTFANNVGEIAVAPASKSKVTSLQDLDNPGVKVALCQPQVPCGVVAHKVLDNANLTVKPVTEGLDVKSTLAYVTTGEADAAIVYVTDVKAAGSKVVPVEIPAADNASTAYPIGVVKDSKNSTLATAFEGYVLSSDGQQVLAAAGFQSP